MAKKIGNALVIGAGIGGIRSALDLAETGHRVTLIDRAEHIGGVPAQLDHQFPSNHCGMCKMLPLVERDAASQFCLRKGLFHENIEIMTATEVAEVSGEPGDFSVRLRQAPRWVDPLRCVGCGLCASVCPVDIPDVFNGGFGTCKAIHLPVPHAVPNPYVIDTSACTRCGACVDVCPTRAIDLCDRRRKGFRILVVDDELVVRDSLKEWLVTEGFPSTRMAASGAEALTMLDQENYHLMLTDIKMPGMDGVELLQKAKERHPQLTVVMMTAYATVETAVEAMKIGALDYFMKPFDPKVMIPLVVRIFERSEVCPDLTRTVHAVIVSSGIDYFNPAGGINPYGYGRSPHVVTSLQFERILSGSGPGHGRLVRPVDGKPIEKVAWMQCVGSRDIQAQADFCSTVCCMYAIKEAMLVKEKSGGTVETTIFFMDLRTGGKNFQHYYDRAIQAGVRFERARVHSIEGDSASGDPVIRVAGMDGRTWTETVDMVVLAVGQRPAAGTDRLAEILDLELNPWGFFKIPPFYPARSSRPGIYLSGSAGGLKDIRGSVMRASSAALEAGRIIRETGGSLQPVDLPAKAPQSLLCDPPNILVVVCRCGRRLDHVITEKALSLEMHRHPGVGHVVFTDHLCTAQGWKQIESYVAEHHPNRLLMGACHPYLFTAKLKELAKAIQLPARLMDVADLHLCGMAMDRENKNAPFSSYENPRRIVSELSTGLVRLTHAAVEVLPGIGVTRRALVVGGGLAGMQAALGIADMGFEVDLVEKSDRLGGNLNRLQETLAGDKVVPFLSATTAAVEKHPLIHSFLNSRVTGAYGQVGNFDTVIETQTDDDDQAAAPVSKIEELRHGVVVLATGGAEAATDQYGHGDHGRVVTQQELEQQLGEGVLDARQLNTVVMIQCVGSREASRNYCSRICCPTSLKHALGLKKANPDLAVYILYRDIMTTGFSEAYYTRARREGVLFIQYDPEHKPQVSTANDRLTVAARDPVLGASLQIETDLLVLATGITPSPQPELLKMFGGGSDTQGFYQEAESKWRPVASLKEGLFFCGIALAPGNMEETVAGGQAAAQRALSILSRTELPAGTFTAAVRHGLCTLCLRCIETCPYSARWVDEEEQQIRINPGMCQGCGACAAACPNGAAVVHGLPKPQVMEMIDAAFAE